MHFMLRLPHNYYSTATTGTTTTTSTRSNNKCCQQKMKEILNEIHVALDKVQTFSNNVRSGTTCGCTGQYFTTIVCIGVGGCHTSTKAVYEALQGDVDAYTATATTTTTRQSSSTSLQDGNGNDGGGSMSTKLRFIADVDPVEFDVAVRDLNPATTLFIVTSTTLGDTTDALHNARLAKRWLIRGLCGGRRIGGGLINGDFSSSSSSSSTTVIDEDEAISKHFCAVTSHPDEAMKFGICPTNIFPLWDWASDQFALWSAAGLLPLSIHYSFNVVRRLLDGAHDIDEHFFDAPLGGNIPVLLGLLGIWNSTFMGYHSRCILPYSRALQSFPSVVQKLDMESNGKCVTAAGLPLNLHAGEINFGDSGSVGLHSFYQLLHQGRPVPADFIGFMESQSPYDDVDNTTTTTTNNNNSNNLQHSSSGGGGGASGVAMGLNDGDGSEFGISGHDELMSNFFAQPDALANGKTMNDLIQEGVEDYLRPHKVFPGKRPSASRLMTQLDAFAIGQLFAIYEHRTVVQGFIWGLNPFDAYGTELGQANAMRVRAQLSASRRRGASVQGFNSSSGFLLEAYLSHGRASR